MSRAVGVGTFNFHGRGRAMQSATRVLARLGAIACLTMAAAVACMPPVTFSAPTQPEVQQQGTAPGGNRPLVSQVGQYPAFSEFTDYAHQSMLYRQWYGDVERCSGKQGQGIDGMRFLLAMTPAFRVNGGGLQLGAYWRDGRTVMFGLGWERDSLIVRHEFLHDVLQLPDSTGDDPHDAHPAALFDTACAAVVFSNRRLRK